MLVGLFCFALSDMGEAARRRHADAVLREKVQKATHVAKAASAVAAAVAGCTSSLPPPLLLTNGPAPFVNDPETGALYLELTRA